MLIDWSRVLVEDILATPDDITAEQVTSTVADEMEGETRVFR